MHVFRVLSVVLFLTALFSQAQTNVLSWDPGISQTGTAVYVNSDTNAGLHLFEITTTNSANNVGFWQSVLNVDSGEADLYISMSDTITTNTYTEKSDTPGSDRIVRSLTPGQTWYALVNSDSNSVWSLFAGDMHVKELTWDPGATQTGTEVCTNSTTFSGRHLFKVTTSNTINNVGFWRTVLNVDSGEADLYISTSDNLMTNSYTQKSDTSGSDRMVRSLTPNQTWYILVESDADSVWSLFSGDMHVKELTWDLGSTQSGTEVYTHPNTREDCYLFRITTTNSPGNLGFWRTVLNVTAGDADLYTDPDANIASNNYQYVSTELGSDTIVQSLTPGQEKYILVETEAGTSWNLFAGDIHLNTLTWDPGTADAGTEVFNNLNTDGGAYYFKVTTELPDLAAWRTALKVLAGDADIYLKQNALPYLNSVSQSFTDSSTYVGDDGFTRYLSNTSGSGQEWYVLVQSDTGSTWDLLSGDVYAADLGALDPGAGSSSGLDAVPPEGIRYYKTTMPISTYAWRLWLKDATDTVTLNRPFYVRHGLAPYPSSGSYYDRTRTGQGLLVPDFVIPGDSTYYFVGIPGEPGDAFQLDSRQQEIIDTAYDNTVTNANVSGFLFKTYRVPVPPDQIAWEVTADPLAGTDPDVAVRLDKVPNPFNNDAFSELVSVTDSDSTTIVPNTLSDGSYYVTVYGANDFNFDLRNREPVITQINFASSTLNDDPGRAGWRYYAVSDIAQQLGQLGWLLELSNQVAETEIAIRRNVVPGRRNYRQNGSTSIYTSAQNDQSSTLGFLQDPEHAADVWYIGVYMPSAPLGSFTLDSGSFSPTVIQPDGHVAAGVQLPPKTWQFHQVTIPAQTNGQDVIGWELRTTSWSGYKPHMVIRSDALPETTGSYNYWRDTSIWQSGYQWSVTSGDWNSFYYDSSGTQQHPNFLISMGMGRPLQPGSYYIGFYNPSPTITSTYSFTSRLIGSGTTYDPQPIAFNGGSAVITNLAPREVQYFSVDVPTNTASWQLHLENSVGESTLYVREGWVPNSAQYRNGTYSPGVSSGNLTMLNHTGDDHYTLLPENGDTSIPAGTYYLMVVSDGQNPSVNNIGVGTSSATLHSLGEAVPTHLGAIPVSGEVPYAGSYGAGEINLIHFDVPPGVLALEVRLEDKVGSPEMNMRTNTLFSYGTSYGSYSGYPWQEYSDTLITVANPPSGTYALMINDSRAVAQLTSGSYTLRVVTVGATEFLVDGGSDSQVTLAPKEWAYYHVDIPAQTNGQDIIGWELRTTSWTNVHPHMVIRRDEAPDNTSSYSYWRNVTNWVSGRQWASANNDWSAYSQNSTGTQQYPETVISMAMGQPLEPGSYYIGFFNNSATVTSEFSFVSSAIGSGMTYDSQPIVFNGGSVAITNLAPRDVQYFTVEVPSNAASWKIHLENSVGDSSLYVREGRVPTSAQYRNAIYSPGVLLDYLPTLQKVGDEHYTLFPENGQTEIPAGTYSLMVVGEGQGASGNRIGTGTSSATLHSLGEAPVTQLGVVPVAGELPYAGSYDSGALNTIQFEVPPGVLAMELRLEDQVGSPEMNLRHDMSFPYGTSYGSYSGHPYQQSNNSLITIANPAPGTYSLLVNDSRSSSSLTSGSYTLRVVTVGAIEIQIDGGSDSSVVLPPKAWHYYHVDIPAQTNGQDIIGWEMRMTSWSNYHPHIVICRDELPDSTSSYSYWRNATNWVSGRRWSTTSGDWSDYLYDASGSQQHPESIISMAMGQPLEPGSYYIGFFNNSTTVTSEFSFVSSAIGSGMTYDPQPIAFNGGSATITNLAPRDLQYFTVEVPSNAASWKIHLENSVGDTSLYVREGRVPNSVQHRNPIYSPGVTLDYLPTLQKIGDEHYTLLPENGQTEIPAGSYTLMVVGEGQGPSGNNIGTGPSSATLYSLGEAPVIQLGALTPGGSVTTPNAYEAGESHLYQVMVPTNMLGVQVRLENVTGDPEINLRVDASFPSGLSYGMYSGRSYNFTSTAILTIPNPMAGLWSFVIGDRNSPTTLSNGDYELVVEDLIPPEMNFDAAFNTNGLSNVVSGVLSNDERIFYKVTVPDTVEGEPVLGWYLTTSMAQGNAQIRVRKDLLPAGSTILETHFYSDALMIAPPYISSGTWYIEVKGVGATDFTLTSSMMTTERSWDMPAFGDALSTPGVASPLFGDTGVDEFGAPLPSDQGVDLNNGYYHVYSVTVPENNTGLLKTQLEALSGNPNLYIREDGLPSLHHGTGRNGTIYDRYLTGTSNTEYGNWVPHDGRYATALDAGTWYIMVKADGASNARYRLKLSCGNVYAGGNVQDLALDGGSLAGQVLADNDFRHYRVVVPTNAPINWEITYSQTSGNVDMFLRDTLPSGNWTYFTDAIHSVRSWHTDQKNSGTTRPNFTDAGTHTLNVPPVRPGDVYYITFVAKSDASFSVSSAISGGSLPTYEQLDFESGWVATNVPANTSITYQVNVPADAVRWIHSITNSSALNVYLEQGTLPSQSSLDHWYRTAGTTTLNEYLLNEAGWPWLPDSTYYLTVVNPTGSPESFDVVMNGSRTIEIPQNVVASDGTYTPYTRVSWNSVSGADTYNLWRSTTNDAQTAALILDGYASTTYNDSDAPAGLLHYYWVSAGGLTNTASFSTPDSGWTPGTGDLSPTSEAFTAAGGMGVITVSAPTGTYWNASENLNWVSLQSGTPGTGTGVVSYTVNEYAGATSRTGVVTVANQSFEVIQSPLLSPVNVQATDGDHMDRTTVTWDLVPEATSYYIYRASTNNYGSAGYMGSVATNLYNDLSGTTDQVYHYWILSRNSGGSSVAGVPDSGYRRSGVVSPGWKTLHFGGGYPGDGIDSDSDGFTNIDEYIADTNPTDGLSFFAIENQTNSLSGFIVHWSSVSGRVYTVNWTDTLTNALSELEANIPFPQNAYTDTVHAADSEGFYVIEVEME